MRLQTTTQALKHPMQTQPSIKNANTAPEIAGSNAANAKVVKSELLFLGGKEVVIDHLGEHYKLRKTSLGKLILTK